MNKATETSNRTDRVRGHIAANTIHDEAFKGEPEMKKSTTIFSGGTGTMLWKSGVSALALLTATALSAPAYAAIDNTATAVGTYTAADDTVSPSDGESVPVVTAAPNLAITKTAAAPTTGAGADGAITDAGDSVTYTYTIENTGNVTLTDVTPVDVGPTFNGETGGGGSLSFTLTSASDDLAPGETATFTAAYTFTTLDILHSAGITNAVSNTATSSGTDPASTTYNDTDGDTAEFTIPAAPGLSVTKVAVLNDELAADSLADVGETITYTYTVVNTGNVALTDVTIDDTHEGTALTPDASWNETLTADGPLATGPTTTASDDTTSGTDGSWDLLQPGATLTFTYVHTVTQTEVDNQ